jgi:hypothetical protein
MAPHDKAQLAKFFFLDRFSPGGWIYDADPFGSFVTEEGGYPTLTAGRRRAIVGCVTIRSTAALDFMLFSLILKAAKHARRYVVNRDSKFEGDSPTFDGPPFYGAYGGYTIVFDDCPEYTGRLCWGGGFKYGAMLYQPGHVGVYKNVASKV